MEKRRRDLIPPTQTGLCADDTQFNLWPGQGTKLGISRLILGSTAAGHAQRQAAFPASDRLIRFEFDAIKEASSPGKSRKKEGCLSLGA
ncbi:hypothetical protein CDAR_379371 [Caerostris darwini]|uniref:Uncharacterized protein n=1 Tax=Caerostris darwini TaxID=1538125 RepID=A0AAV4V9C7_9ARAC|nr:hypothetical protein CDAR_379371 [Caerostris darwini]